MSPAGRLVFAVLGGLAAGLVYAPVGAHWLAWCGFAPLIFACWTAASAREALKSGFLGGLGYFLVGLSYLAPLGLAPWLAAAAVLAIYFALLGVLIFWLAPSRRPWGVALLPFLFSGMEWLKELGPLGYPLATLGATHTVMLSRWEAVGGVFLASAVLFCCNLLMALGLYRLLGGGFSKASVGWALACAGLLVGAGLVPLPACETAGSLKVALVQPSPRLVFKEGVRNFAGPEQAWQALKPVLEEAFALPAELIILPETATCRIGPAETLPEVVWCKQAARRRRKWVIFGVSVRRKRGAPTHNAALVIGPDGTLHGTYYKHRLVTFGEYLPWRKQLDFLWKRYPVRAYDYSPGPAPAPLEIAGHKVGLLICFEGSFSRYARELVRQGAEALVVITNDGWSPRLAAADETLQATLPRAFETQRALARAALTGHSALVDPVEGRMSSTACNVRTVLYGELPLYKQLTPYVRWGRWFGPGCAILLLCCLLAGLCQTFKRSRRQ